MWSSALLFLLVATVCASNQHGFEDGKDYTYKVRSRTLATINPLSKQFAGILVEARLTIQSDGKNQLRGIVSEPRYTQVHTHLENGWDSKIPENQKNYQNLPMSNQPFELKTKNGAIRDLIVDKDLPTWEVNMLKAMISQLQVDLKGENSEKSRQNQFPESGQPFGMFRVMEDSVDGKCEVLYDISPLPEHMLQNNPELAPLPQLREDGDMISLVKTKNYSNCNQRISYHFGINGRNKWEPGSNDNGKYLSRSSVSRVALSGSSKKYTIQSSVTINKVVLSPDQQDNQQGMVMSKMNLTLNEVKDVSEKLFAPANPQSTGNLVYNYNNPTESSSSRRPNKLNRRSKSRSSKNSDESSSDSSDSTDNEDEDNYMQPKPKLVDAPLNPMLSYFIGNHGNSIQKNNKVNVVRSVVSIAREIGNDLQKSDRVSEEHTLEKFTILTRLIRTMNAEQIDAVQNDVFENPRSTNQITQNSQEKSSRRNAWIAARDAIAQAGTGPALVNIKKMVKNKQIQGFEAAGVIDSMAKSTRTPTLEYMDAFFELVKMEETKQQPEVRDTALLSFADLVRHAIVNKRSAHNRYPVHAFGKLFGSNNRNLQEKYFSYLTEELKSAIDSGDSKKIQVNIAALGRTAHPRILSVFEPYIEGRKQVSEYQRLLMIISLDQLATIHPKAAQSVLYKIYSNNADSHEIRTAAVYLLMKTHPPASMIQRMAELTNYDSNKHVNSAVKSVIESLAELQGNENRDLSDAAKTALPLLTSENYGPQYSKAIFKNFKNPETHTGISLAAYFVGSDDSIVPRGISLAASPNIQGLKMPKIQMTSVVSSTRNLFEFVEQQLTEDKNEKASENEKDRKYSPESIAKLLGIQGFGAKQLEGFFVINENTKNIFMAFDNHSLEQIPKKIKQMNEDLRKGISVDEAEFNNYEVTMSFPTETGFPLTFTLKTPSVVSIKGHSKAEKSGNSEKVTAKAKVTIALRVQKRISFVTPFENQEYVSGIDKDLQVFLPVKGEMKYDTTQNEVNMKIQPAEDEPEYKVLQYKKQPFTSKHDILSLRPVSNDKNTHVIHKSHAIPSQIELNDWNNNPSVQFSYERQSNHRADDRDSRENKRQNAMTAAHKLVRGIVAMVYPIKPEKSEEYEKYSVKVTPKNDMSAEMKLSYSSMSSNSENEESDGTLNAKAPSLDKKLNANERKKKLLQEATKKINSADGYALDADFRLNVGAWSSVTVTAAVAASNVDPKSRAVVHATLSSQGEPDYSIASAIEAKMPNVKSLDYEETLRNDNIPLEVEADIRCGQSLDDDDIINKIKIQGKLEQTEKRKNEIRESHDVQTCKKEIKRSGNKMSSACQKANHRAVSVDAAEVTVILHKDLSAQQLAEDVVESIERVSQTRAETPKDYEDKEEKNKIKISVQLSSKDDKADVSVKSAEGKVNIKNIKIGNIGHEINSGSSGHSEKQNSELSLMQPRTCSLDKTEVKTFDNKRYPSQIGKCWHVAVTSYPEENPGKSNKRKDIPDNMRVSVLTREDENEQKELKIMIGEKEIDLKPSKSASRRVDAEVEGKKIELSQKRSHQERKNGRVVVEIFELPDKSVKVVSDKHSIEIVYDGTRAEIEAGERYRNSIRGLCGNNDGESENDLQTPKGCLLQRPEEFSATYALTKDEQCQGPARENAEKAKISQCTYENPRPGNVISDREAGRRNEEDSREDKYEESAKQNIKNRTMVQRKGDKICFSKRPVATCSSQSSPKETKSKNVEFHCVPKTDAAEKIAERVEKGANPDLTQKKTDKIESVQIPVSCRA